MFWFTWCGPVLPVPVLFCCCVFLLSIQHVRFSFCVSGFMCWAFSHWYGLPSFLFRLGILWEVAGVVCLLLAGRFIFMSVQFSTLFYSLLREFVMGSLGARDFSGWTGCFYSSKSFRPDISCACRFGWLAIIQGISPSNKISFDDLSENVIYYIGISPG